MVHNIDCNIEQKWLQAIFELKIWTFFRLKKTCVPFPKKYEE